MFDAAKRVASLHKDSNLLSFYSGPGLGKTHLLAAIGNDLLSSTDKTFCYYTATMFIAELKSFKCIDRVDDFIESFSHLDVLLFDDIDQLESDECAQEVALMVLSNLYAEKASIVVSSRDHPRRLGKVNAEIIAFLCKGEMFGFEPDLETKFAVLKFKYDEIGLFVSEETIRYLAGIEDLSYRELCIYSESLASYAKLKGTAIDTVLINTLPFHRNVH
ncbi:MAG: hypothetical protein C0623_04710 [Desulfuromonas sp.]|nr:MAG: hypothetical protein C0623_04710 [Desulfuromonas sp.]